MNHPVISSAVHCMTQKFTTPVIDSTRLTHGTHRFKPRNSSFAGVSCFRRIGNQAEASDMHEWCTNDNCATQWLNRTLTLLAKQHRWNIDKFVSFPHQKMSQQRDQEGCGH